MSLKICILAICTSVCYEMNAGIWTTFSKICIEELQDWFSLSHTLNLKSELRAGQNFAGKKSVGRRSFLIYIRQEHRNQSQLSLGTRPGDVCCMNNGK